ncbi:hypothetical protein [Rhizobium bangladeshense]|uniref:hypothetical protein n=1 Tax=Rhizobium bangladeshense TaxID=1138189 RepID=UPI0012E8A920|nr:hypothetical protein [Rhizobium bangladeshense]
MFEFHRQFRIRLWEAPGAKQSLRGRSQRASFFTTSGKKQDIFGSAANFPLAALREWFRKIGSAAKIGWRPEDVP